MGAVDAQQAGTAEFVAKQREVLAEDAHRHRGSARGKLVGEGHRLPVASQQLAARGARPGPREEVVLIPREHAMPPFKSLPDSESDHGA